MENSNIIYEKKFPKRTAEDYDRMWKVTDRNAEPHKQPDSATFLKNLVENNVLVMIPDRMEI